MLRILLGIFLFFALATHPQLLNPSTPGDGFPFPAPPPADANPVVDNYNGAKIPDSYRWLEDSKSPETRAFIDAQNAYTSHYLKLAHIRVAGRRRPLCPRASLPMDHAHATRRQLLLHEAPLR
jgi:hypothetical protein